MNQPIIYFHTVSKRLSPFLPLSLSSSFIFWKPFYYYVCIIFVHKFKKVRLCRPLVFGWLNLCLLMWSENIHTVSILPCTVRCMCIVVCQPENANKALSLLRDHSQHNRNFSHLCGTQSMLIYHIHTAAPYIFSHAICFCVSHTYNILFSTLFLLWFCTRLYLYWMAVERPLLLPYLKRYSILTLAHKRKERKKWSSNSEWIRCTKNECI